MRNLAALAIGAVAFFAVAPTVSAQLKPKAAPKAALKAAPKAPVAAALPNFDFMGQNPDQPSTMEAINGKKCGAVDAEGKRTCTDFDNPKLGNATLKWLSVYFYDNKMYMILGSASKYQLTDILSAFEAKYGKPTLVRKDTWRNAAGASFENPIFVWKFKEGDLELSSTGSRIGDTDFSFTAPKSSPPEKKAPVNF